jgi:ketosteroid isomerase-like protein
VTSEPEALVSAAERAFNDRAVDDFVSLVHPEVAWETGLPGTPTYRGRSGVRQLFSDIHAAWSELRVIATLEAQGANSLVAGRQMSGRGKTTGAPVEGRQFVAVELRDGLAFRVHAYADRPSALEAAGLAE